MKKIVLLVAAVAMIGGLSSCKPKQSAYRAAYERAKQREIAQNGDEAVVPVTPPAQVTYGVVRKEKVTPATGEDPKNLKTFSVVIGSFQNLTNAKSLKERMIAEGYKAILAQNEQGMYRVIVTSFDRKQDAVNSREAVKARFAPLFQDAWILYRAN